MFKHNYKHNIVHNGKTYYTSNGVVELPEIVKCFNPIEEIKNVTDTDEKVELIKMAVELGCGAESSLKRNSIETLKKKIEEA